MNWSPEQTRALDAVAAWLKSPDGKPFFYLAGYAGTGKSSLARHLAEGAGNVLYASFTGKAAAVMRSKGCEDATTIHRLIYHPKPKSMEGLVELRRRLEAATFEGNFDLVTQLQAEAAEEARNIRTPSFRLNPDSDVRAADLVVIDECSTVNARMGEDLLSFGTPVLVLGDPAQLPPVAGGGFFTGEPDAMLTDVHRHDSGILDLATRVRNGEPLEYCELNGAQVIPKGDLNPERIPADYDQVLVGRNGTRRATNRRMRELLGRTQELPEQGDRLVCLKNCHDLGLLNGELWDALDAEELDDDLVGLTIQNDAGEALCVEAWRHPFDGRDMPHWDKDVQTFTYGYCLTVHKSQGSAWPRVLLFDESRFFRQHAQRWIYTGITRASEFLTVVK